MSSSGLGPGHTETSHFGLVIAGAQLACVIRVTRSHQTLSAKLEWLVFLTRQILDISKPGSRIDPGGDTRPSGPTMIDSRHFLPLFPQISPVRALSYKPTTPRTYAMGLWECTPWLGERTRAGSIGSWEIVARKEEEE